jgi:endonuclease/exonuclease/phosphatase family metal-dependent hydrolase
MDGCWILYYPANVLHLVIDYLKQLKPNPHIAEWETKNATEVLVWCPLGISTHDILQVGEFLIFWLQYKSITGTFEFRRKEHVVFILDVPCSLTRTHVAKQPQCIDVDMKVSSVFEVPFSRKESAKKKGAVWNSGIQQWFAPTDAIWHNMALEFKQQQPEPSPQMVGGDLSVYTMNVWLSDEHMQARMLAIIDSISQHTPDVLCLQEVTPKNFRLLDCLIRELGYRSQSTIGEKRFGEMLYYNANTLTLQAFEQRPFPESTMKRDLHILHATLKTSQQHIIFATAHFEPGRERKNMRLQQARFTLNTLENQSIVHTNCAWVFAGDTNLSHFDEVHLPQGALDVWQATGSDPSKKQTWDPTCNTNLQRGAYGCRFDRVWCSWLHPTCFNVTCQQLLSETQKHASDHFGVVCQFS